MSTIVGVRPPFVAPVRLDSIHLIDTEPMGGSMPRHGSMGVDAAMMRLDGRRAGLRDRAGRVFRELV